MLWLKQFRKKKMQSALIFIIITLCSLLITGSLVILTSLGKQYEELAVETDAVDLKIYPSSELSASGDSWVSTLNKIDGVSQVCEIERLTVETLIIHGEKTDAFIDICRYDEGVYGKSRLPEGSFEALTSGKCALPSAFAYEHDIDIGDSITVPLGDRKISFEVAAIYSEIYSMSIAFTSDILVSDFDGAESNGAVYAVRLENGFDTDMLISEYTALTDGILDGNFRSAEECIGNATITEKILGGILLGISSVILAVIFVIIGFIVKNAVRTEKKSIAVYKAMGYTNGRIAGIYITFYQSLVLVGSVTGVLLSNLVSSAFMQAAFRNLAVENNASDALQKLCCALVINAAAYIMLKLEFIRLSRIRPVEILTGNEDGIGRKKLRHSRREITSFSPFSMAVRMLRREGKRTTLILLSCIMSVYVINISVVCLENLDLIGGETNYYWLGIDKHDVTIENLGGTEKFYEICDELSGKDAVVSLTKKNYNKGFAIPYHQSLGGMVFEDFDSLEMDVLEGRNPMNGSEAVVGNICLKEFGLEIGDYIDVYLDAEHSERLLIVGTYQGFYNMGRGIKVMGSAFEESGTELDYTAASVTLSEGEDKEEFIRFVEDNYGDYVKAVDRLDIYSSIMSMICDPQRSALLPFVAVTVIIGAVNLFYIIYSNNREKRRTYTIYKSMGYSASHLLKMNLWYIGIIAAASVAVAVPALIWVFPQVMLLAMSGFGFAEYHLVLNPTNIAFLNAALFTLFIATGCLSSRDLFRNHISYIINE